MSYGGFGSNSGGRGDVPLRILFIAPTGFFADYGCHVRIRGQAEALQRRGHQIRIVTYPAGRDILGLDIIRPPILSRHRQMPVGSSWRKILLDTILFPIILGVTRRFRPHVIHAFLHEGALLGLLPARWTRVPLVFDFQGSLTGEMLDHGFLSQRSPLLGVWRRLERWIDHQPDVILASSQHATKMLSIRFGVSSTRVRAVPDSVDPEEFRPPQPADRPRLDALRARWHLPVDRPIIVYLGLLAPYQGIDLLLEAARILLKERLASLPELPHFLIMGFPHVDRYSQQARTLGIAQHVTFTGKIPFEEAPAYLRLGTIAVATKLSETEGSGKLLTYMATGLPVVAFDTPVHREYLSEWGAYARPGDPVDLADAIQTLLTSPERARRLGEALRARAMQSFNWDVAARQILDAYAEVCGASRAVL
ncbi:MAG TPA: glycosyltransferase family 4 protein [Caldilineae bacterium]|nr:glycosyltransferase family 4 protein [Caldilineae bacterium]